MPSVSKALQDDPAVGADGDPSDGRVLEAEPKPGLGIDLEGAAEEVADDVGVAHDQLIAIFFLRLTTGDSFTCFFKWM